MATRVKPTARRRSRPTPRQNAASAVALLAVAPEAWIPCLYVSHAYPLPGRCPLEASLSASACVSDADGSTSLTVRLWLDGKLPAAERERLRAALEGFLLPRGFERYNRALDVPWPALVGERPVDEDFHKHALPAPALQRELAELHAFLSGMSR
jgi:hypothetical protein